MNLETYRVITALYVADEPIKKLIPSAIQCEGKYKNTVETSWIITYEEYQLLKQNTNFLEGQECVLVIPPENKLRWNPCFFEYPNGEKREVGRLVEVSEEEATKSEGYTKVLETGRYFILK